MFTSCLHESTLSWFIELIWHLVTMTSYTSGEKQARLLAEEMNKAACHMAKRAALAHCWQTRRRRLHSGVTQGIKDLCVLHFKLQKKPIIQFMCSFLLPSMKWKHACRHTSAYLCLTRPLQPQRGAWQAGANMIIQLVVINKKDTKYLLCQLLVPMAPSFWGWVWVFFWWFSILPQNTNTVEELGFEPDGGGPAPPFTLTQTNSPILTHNKSYTHKRRHCSHDWTFCRRQN